MPQQIRNAGTKATAWVEHIVLSPSRQVKRSKKLSEFTERLRFLCGPSAPLDVTGRERMEVFLGY